MSHKTAILAVIAVLMGLGLMTSAFAKPAGKTDIQFTGDLSPIASTTSDGGGEDDGGDEGSGDDDDGVPVIIWIDINQVVEDDASI